MKQDNISNVIGMISMWVQHPSNKNKKPYGFIEQQETQERLYFNTNDLTENFPDRKLRSGTFVQIDNVIDGPGDCRIASGISLYNADSK